MIRKILKKLDWTYDYYILYFMYNERKLDRYNKYMEQKWGKNEY
jgi:hypothetical protein